MSSRCGRLVITTGSRRSHPVRRRAPKVAAKSLIARGARYDFAHILPILEVDEARWLNIGRELNILANQHVALIQRMERMPRPAERRNTLDDLAAKATDLCSHLGRLDDKTYDELLLGLTVTHNGDHSAATRMLETASNALLAVAGGASMAKRVMEESGETPRPGQPPHRALPVTMRSLMAGFHAYTGTRPTWASNNARQPTSRFAKFCVAFFQEFDRSIPIDGLKAVFYSVTDDALYAVDD